jgi:hypothetical protein
MTKTLFQICIVPVFMLLSTACSNQPIAPKVEFGDTVRSVMEKQIHDLEAAMNPNPDAIEGSDPYRMDANLEAYRNEVGQAKEVQQPITINTGN